MLDMSEVTQVVEKVVSASPAGPALSRVLSAPTLDSAGEAALDVKIVLRNDTVDDALVRALSDNMLWIIRGLEASGEERFPILSYATEEELAQDDDPES
jgi:hypothetical protein